MRTAAEDRNWRKSSHSGSGDNSCVEVRWRKSSYSGGGNDACVEVAWHKSSYSGSGNGACVEVAFAIENVGVRDSKNVAGPALSFPPAAWQTFARTVD